MHYAVRAYVEGRDQMLDEMCRVFSSMERTAYNFLEDDAKDGMVKAVLRERYGVENARWCQSAINQARGVMGSQEDGSDTGSRRTGQRRRTRGRRWSVFITR